MHQFSKGDTIETTEDYLAGVRTVRPGTRGTVLHARPEPAGGVGNQLLTVEFVGMGARRLQIFSRRVKLVVETTEELFTIHQPWDLKPGDVVDTVPEPYSAAGVQVRRQVPVAPPKPLPPTQHGSHIIGRPTSSRTHLFLNSDGRWVNIHGAAWSLKSIQDQGFEVIHDAGAKS